MIGFLSRTLARGTGDPGLPSGQSTQRRMGGRRGDTVTLLTVSPAVPDSLTVSPAVYDSLTVSPAVSDSLTVSPAVSDSLTVSPAVSDSLTVSPAVSDQ
ncbi:hypothetical protein FJT64_019210 [Amphibalanus amphitrite]|uniref:Uncharacterized protein n=1 Tax=Amphibalanus amphitrite TaxID=1232801 RepID=A0A6A4X4B6_AMPAM|nr:hypothetical protein FJT64_019210 [Amphibalanus amphitrite]